MATDLRHALNTIAPCTAYDVSDCSYERQQLVSVLVATRGRTDVSAYAGAWSVMVVFHFWKDECVCVRGSAVPEKHAAHAAQKCHDVHLYTTLDLPHLS
jgi:hypothetical protein